MIDAAPIRFPCIKVRQPIGEFYIASMSSKDLCRITYADIRRIEKDEERPIERYLGIQRPLDPKRVIELAKYVRTLDATFPTSVIIAVSGQCAEYDEKRREMSLSHYLDVENDENSIPFNRIAQILDGQHRLDGLKDLDVDPPFEINVSIFIDADLATQANIFSTVNLAQTKVNKSLVFDLFSVAKARSPQKTCHLIAVGLDELEGGPFYQRIKRLGVATEGRFNETITQATFVQGLMPYLSDEPLVDRDTYIRGKTPSKATADQLKRLPFRNMFIEGKDLDIADVVANFFQSVKNRWPQAWNAQGTGYMLNKTNGYRALIRFLRPAYLSLVGPGEIPSTADFAKIMKKIDLKDGDFTIDEFKPGTSGESKLYRTLLSQSALDG